MAKEAKIPPYSPNVAIKLHFQVAGIVLKYAFISGEMEPFGSLACQIMMKHGIEPLAVRTNYDAWRSGEFNKTA